MSTKILIEGKVESDEVLRNDRKQQQSLSPTLGCTQTENLSLIAKSVLSLSKDIYDIY